MKMNSLSDCEVLPCKGSHPTAACIFLHGTGETGAETKAYFKKLFRNSSHRYITFYFPSASKRYMKIRDTETTFWFDAERYGPENEEVEGCIEEADKVVNMLENMVNEVEASGIPRSRIAIGGSSQGGMVSLLAVYARALKVGAVVTIASTLVFRKSTELLTGVKIPLLSLYGDQDAFITMKNMSYCWNVFRDKDITFTPRTIPKCGHSMSIDYIRIIVDWLEQKFPFSASRS